MLGSVQCFGIGSGQRRSGHFPVVPHPQVERVLGGLECADQLAMHADQRHVVRLFERRLTDAAADEVAAEGSVRGEAASSVGRSSACIARAIDATGFTNQCEAQRAADVETSRIEAR